ncbi:hypothetical protein [Enterococcus sp. OL5]|uniref:P-type ATPase n=1 Tax=Enterococcus sp. OL5 TaxID=2590214 RepID=UPI0039834A80
MLLEKDTTDNLVITIYIVLNWFVLALRVIIVPSVFWADFSEWFYRGLRLLVAACPCPLLISTPVSNR